MFRTLNRPDRDKYEAWAFGGDTDGLASLVLEGQKTATASAYDLYAYDNEELPGPGDYSVVLDSSDNAVCVIRNVSVSVVPFNEVDEGHAAREGEGDLSLGHWKDVHRDLFSQWLEEAGMEFSDEIPVVLETFEVVFRP